MTELPYLVLNNPPLTSCCFVYLMEAIPAVQSGKYKVNIAFAPCCLHVQLPNKRRKVAMLKMLGQHIFGKFNYVANNKRCSIVIPCDETLARRIVYHTEWQCQFPRSLMLQQKGDYLLKQLMHKRLTSRLGRIILF